MPNPRLSAAERKRRGTFRSDRDYDARDAITAPDSADETLAEYRRLAGLALVAAARKQPLPVVEGPDIIVTPQWLRTVERAMARSGIVQRDSINGDRPYRMSYLVYINLPNDGTFNPPE